MIAIIASLLLSGCLNPTTSNQTSRPATVIDIVAIAGVTAPIPGAMPVIEITETAQYTGTVAWSPLVDDRFGTDTVITATITLTAKKGYTLTGVGANSFAVGGAITTNEINSGIITAHFTAIANLSAVSDVASSSQSTIVLKAVPGGTFNNGVADMTVSSFRMSQHEITMEQFVAVTGLSNPSTFFTGVVNGPVQWTNWYHALVFCNKLSVADDLTPVYSISGTTNTDTWGTVPTSSDATWNAVVADWSSNGYRLPTEAEWEFAARGGNSTKEYTYAGSNTIGDVAWYNLNAGSTPHPVGGKVANELGLYDMSGNVWEWCWDWYADIYSGFPQTDYRGATSGSFRVQRGGSWYDTAPFCTVGIRNYFPSFTQGHGTGFRVVRP